MKLEYKKMTVASVYFPGPGSSFTDRESDMLAYVGLEGWSLCTISHKVAGESVYYFQRSIEN